MPCANGHFLSGHGVGGTYTLWEHSEAYANDSGSESHALTPEKTIPSKKKPESTGT